MNSIKKNQVKAALITGANSGIGFVTASRLAEEGLDKVILAVRTQEKGEIARKQLIEKTGRDIYEILTIDVSEFDVVHDSVDELVKRKSKIDLIILNAGMSPRDTNTYNSAGVEMTMASNIVGHHIFTMRLVGEDLLSENARIVIAGSEGARGDVPGMRPPDFQKLADEHFKGDLTKTMEAILRHEKPYEDKLMNLYVTSKTFSAWWAAVLSEKLPKGMIVNTISPGSVPATNFARHQGFMMRRVMMPMMNYVGRFVGMSWNIENAANRYIEGGLFDDSKTGSFYASPPKKMTGKMEIQKNPHFLNKEYQQAGWKALVKVSNGIDYPVTIPA